MMDRLFSYPDRATAEAVRDALRRIAPAFALEVGSADPGDGLSRVTQARDEGDPVYWIVGDRRLIALFELAGDVFGKGGLIAAKVALEGLSDRREDGLGNAPEAVHARQHTAAEIEDAIRATHRNAHGSRNRPTDTDRLTLLRNARVLRSVLDDVRPRRWPVPETVLAHAGCSGRGPKPADVDRA